MNHIVNVTLSGLFDEVVQPAISLFGLVRLIDHKSITMHLGDVIQDQ